MLTEVATVDVLLTAGVTVTVSTVVVLAAGAGWAAAAAVVVEAEVFADLAAVWLEGGAL